MVMSGGIYVPPMIMRTHLASKPAPATANGWGVRLDDASAGSGPRAGAPLAALGLTPRQTDVLALLLQGQPNKLIARALNLSVETVKDHVAAVLRTLNVSSRTQAVLAVSQMSHQGALAAWRESRQAASRHG
jgi:DNA-binding NarL/FixJ family response regulator